MHCAVSVDGTISSAPGEEEWTELLNTARKQSVLGVTFPVVDRTPEKDGPSLRDYSKWALMDEKIRQNYDKTLERARELCGIFERADLRCCILKGLGTARYYPDPSRRQSGDIDIWVEGKRKDTISFLESRYKVDDIVYHHCEAEIFPDLKVEVHFTPSWLNNPFRNRKLQKYYKDSFEGQHNNRDEMLGIPVPTAEFSAVHCMIHIFRHILHEGIGIRQFMDLYYILGSLSEKGREEVRRTLEELGLERCSKAVMYVIQDLFGTEDDHLLFPPDKKSGQFLLREISLSGNFGKYDKRNKKVYGESLPVRAYARISRLIRFVSFAPSEVFFAPGFKAWQYYWKKQYQ